MRRVLATLLILCAAPVRAEDPSFALPIDCTLGESCFIQNYMDRDASPKAADFTCGPLTYDGHKGTDIALLSRAAMDAGVTVRAAAPGVVLGTRDEMPDILFTDDRAADIDGRDCGNGVLIDHGDGWQSQYCHMKRGSIAVSKGQTVSEATMLGQVGLSGRTQFPHLHLTVRKDGEPVDPFRPANQTTCSTDTPGTLWHDPQTYVPGGLIAAGFAPSVPEYDAIKDGTAAAQTIPTNADGLVLWVYAFGARQNDILQFEFTGPRGLAFSNTVTLEKTQAQLFRATGKRRKTAPWPAGPISGTIRLLRDGVQIDQHSVTARIAD